MKSPNSTSTIHLDGHPVYTGCAGEITPLPWTLPAHDPGSLSPFDALCALAWALDELPTGYVVKTQPHTTTTGCIGLSWGSLAYFAAEAGLLPSAPWVKPYDADEAGGLTLLLGARLDITRLAAFVAQRRRGRKPMIRVDAVALGNLLRMTAETREFCRAWQVTAIDETRAERSARKQRERAEAARLARRLAGVREHGAKRGDAATWLVEQLQRGPLLARDVERAANGAGHNWRTIRRAAKSLNVCKMKQKRRGGAWIWFLT